MPLDNFEEVYEKQSESVKTKKVEKTESFVFPEKTPEWEKKRNEAEGKINDSVKTFANNLDKIRPWLTRRLLDIFDKFKKDPQFKWLSESDLWLHSLGELYKTGEIPNPLESILNEMMQLLNDYKVLRNKSKTLEEMLRACAFVCDYEINGKWRNPNKPLFTQESHEWWRWKLW